VVIHRACKSASPAALSPRISPTPTFKRSRLGSHRDYGSPFHEAEAPLPGRPGPPTAGSLPSASFIHFEAFLPLQVRSHQRGLPRTGGRYSWVFSPLKTEPSMPLSLVYPPNPEGPSTTRRPWTPRRDARDSSPKRRVKSHRRSEDQGSTSSAVTLPYGPDRTASRRQLFLS
jgi:hypothetical protein